MLERDDYYLLVLSLDLSVVVAGADAVVGIVAEAHYHTCPHPRGQDFPTA